MRRKTLRCQRSMDALPNPCLPRLPVENITTPSTLSERMRERNPKEYSSCMHHILWHIGKEGKALALRQTHFEQFGEDEYSQRHQADSDRQPV